MADDDIVAAEVERRFPTAGDLGKAPEAVIDYRDLVKAKAKDEDKPSIPTEKPKIYSQSPDFGPPPFYQTPRPPSLTDIPNPYAGMPPTAQSSFEVFKNPIIALAALGSLFTRRPLMHAMSFATGAMNGYNDGQEQVFNQNKQRFHEAVEAAAAQNKVELERYGAAWDRSKIENWNSALPRLWTEAGRNNDQAMMTALRMGPEAAEKLFIQRESVQSSLDRATELAKIRADIAAEQKYGAGNTPADAARDIVDGMERGDQPPTTVGLGQLTGSVRADAARRHFNLAQAQLEWLGAQTQMRSLHGPQMTRYFALADSVQSTIDRVLETSKELGLGQYPVKNHADLIYLVQTKGNTKEGKLAVQYLADIGTLKEEFANLAQGGGVPTEPAWAQANTLINGDFGVDALATSLKEVRRLIGFRVLALKEQGSQPYSPTGPQAPPAAQPEGAGGVIRYDSQGNRVQ